MFSSSSFASSVSLGLMFSTNELAISSCSKALFIGLPPKLCAIFSSLMDPSLLSFDILVDCLGVLSKFTVFWCSFSLLLLVTVRVHGTKIWEKDEEVMLFIFMVEGMTLHLSFSVRCDDLSWFETIFTKDVDGCIIPCSNRWISLSTNSVKFTTCKVDVEVFHVFWDGVDWSTTFVGISILDVALFLFSVKDTIKDGTCEG